MVEYKKKKIQLQNGGSRNYYYKVLASGEKQRIKKEEYLEKTKKKGGEGENKKEFYSGTVKKIQTGTTLFGKEKENTNKQLTLKVNKKGNITGTYGDKGREREITSLVFNEVNKTKATIGTRNGLKRDVRLNEDVYKKYDDEDWKGAFDRLNKGLQNILDSKNNNKTNKINKFLDYLEKNITIDGAIYKWFLSSDNYEFIKDTSPEMKKLSMIGIIINNIWNLNGEYISMDLLNAFEKKYKNEYYQVPAYFKIKSGTAAYPSTRQMKNIFGRYDL